MDKWRRSKFLDVAVHSDQESSNVSGDYTKLLKEINMLCGLSHKGECYESAVAESFFGTLKQN